MVRVLVVDDEEFMREMLRDMLHNAGYLVEEARDGEEAEAMYRAEPHDLVITDILMPRKGGLNVIRDLRKAFPDSRFIAISGGGKDGQLNFLGTARAFPGVVGLDKPFDYQDLMAAVRQVLA